jgi:hypothetical protein
MVVASVASGQEFDKVWVQGAGISYKTTFTPQGPVNSFLDTFYSPYFANGNSSICDSSGNLLLCSDGYNVYDSTAALIQNGDTLVPKLLYEHYDGWSGYDQTSIILPVGNNKYYLITPTASDSEVAHYWWNNPTGGRALFDLLLYHVIDMNANNGHGAVVRKKVPLLEYTPMSKTQMMACKHGDGKSWWLLKQGHDTNKIYKFLFTQDSVYGPYIQAFPQPFFTKWDITGQSVFTKDGSRYATTCMGAGKIFLADFDRCSGNLSNPVVIDVPNLWTTNSPFNQDTDRNIAGLAFSPNGQFLYLAKDFNILQYDLNDPNPGTAWYHVAGLDTTWDRFMMYSSLYLGPDNKLYIGNWNGLSKEMSVINTPNSKGVACNFCPRCLRNFPHLYYTSNGTVYDFPGVDAPPCMPNYRLGPTNPPCWVTDVPEVEKASVFKLYPNPNAGRFTIQYMLEQGEEGKVQITDLQGRLIEEVILSPMLSFQQMDLSKQANGIYFYRFVVNGLTRYSGKIEVIK